MSFKHHIKINMKRFLRRSKFLVSKFIKKNKIRVIFASVLTLIIIPLIIQLAPIFLASFNNRYQALEVFNEEINPVGAGIILASGTTVNREDAIFYNGYGGVIEESYYMGALVSMNCENKNEKSKNVTSHLINLKRIELYEDLKQSLLVHHVYKDGKLNYYVTNNGWSELKDYDIELQFKFHSQNDYEEKDEFENEEWTKQIGIYKKEFHLLSGDILEFASIDVYSNYMIRILEAGYNIVAVAKISDPDGDLKKERVGSIIMQEGQVRISEYKQPLGANQPDSIFYHTEIVHVDDCLGAEEIVLPKILYSDPIDGISTLCSAIIPDKSCRLVFSVNIKIDGKYEINSKEYDVNVRVPVYDLAYSYYGYFSEEYSPYCRMFALNMDFATKDDLTEFLYDPRMHITDKLKNHNKTMLDIQTLTSHNFPTQIGKT